MSRIYEKDLEKLNEKQQMLYLSYLLNEVKPYLPKLKTLNTTIALFDKFLLDKSKVTATELKAARRMIERCKYSDSIEAMEYLIQIMEFELDPQAYGQRSSLDNTCTDIDMFSYLCDEVIADNFLKHRTKAKYEAFKEIKDLDRSVFKWLTEGK